MQFITKFAVNDTSYTVDLTTADITPISIVDVYVHQSSTALGQTIITYRGINQLIYNETDLYSLDDAKLKAQEIINLKLAAIQNL